MECYHELVELVVGERRGGDGGGGALEARLECGGAPLDGPRLLAEEREPKALLERQTREVRAQQVPLERIQAHRLRLPVLAGAHPHTRRPRLPSRSASQRTQPLLRHSHEAKAQLHLQLPAVSAANATGALSCSKSTNTVRRTAYSARRAKQVSVKLRCSCVLRAVSLRLLYIRLNSNASYASLTRKSLVRRAEHTPAQPKLN